MKTPELKPCPFCGGNPYITDVFFGSPYDGGFRDIRMTIECKCGVKLEGEYTLMPNSDVYPTQLSTVEQWNRRVTNENA